MTLGEFLNHIKHKSLKIEIHIESDILFEGTIGEYSTSVVKSKINNKKVSGVYPSWISNDLLKIYLEL